MKIRLGDKVIKNPDTWVANPEADLYGRGTGIGVVKAVDSSGMAEVQWPAGPHIENSEGLKKAPTDDPMEKWIEMASGPWFIIPAVVIRHMPMEWQEKLADMIDEADDMFIWKPAEKAKYRVTALVSAGYGSLRSVSPMNFEKKAQPK